MVSDQGLHCFFGAVCPVGFLRSLIRGFTVCSGLSVRRFFAVPDPGLHSLLRAVCP